VIHCLNYEVHKERKSSIHRRSKKWCKQKYTACFGTSLDCIIDPIHKMVRH
jgi:hypothetical protein